MDRAYAVGVLAAVLLERTTDGDDAFEALAARDAGRSGHRHISKQLVEPRGAIKTVARSASRGRERQPFARIFTIFRILIAGRLAIRSRRPNTRLGEPLRLTRLLQIRQVDVAQRW